jgi:hypothetical protein
MGQLVHELLHHGMDPRVSAVYRLVVLGLAFEKDRVAQQEGP